MENKEFENIHKTYLEKRDQLYKINKSKYDLENELKIIKLELQIKCNHIFVREETTSGCYREFHNICKICNLWR
jgi:hypothetical protein